jgi:hypothetical protein
MVIRLEGYYWVEWQGEWVVAFWNHRVWWIATRDEEFEDSDFTVITQERLNPPE